MKVAIIGNGFVGKKMQGLFPEALVVDKDDEKTTNKADVAFVCVPTPLGAKGLDTSIVEEVVEWCDSDVIVVRSTLNPGDSDRLTKQYGKRIVVQPEYFGETVDHPMKEDSFIIIGGEPQDRRKLIELYTTVYNANLKIRQVTRLEAEVIKLSENRAISFKLAQCQELYDACERNGVDYYTIRDAVYGDDPRFNLWWSFILEKRGFESKCIPKDVYAWANWAGDCSITDAILKQNEKWISLS